MEIYNNHNFHSTTNCAKFFFFDIFCTSSATLEVASSNVALEVESTPFVPFSFVNTLINYN